MRGFYIRKIERLFSNVSKILSCWITGQVLLYATRHGFLVLGREILFYWFRYFVNILSSIRYIHPTGLFCGFLQSSGLVQSPGSNLRCLNELFCLGAEIAVSNDSLIRQSLHPEKNDPFCLESRSR